MGLILSQHVFGELSVFLQRLQVIIMYRVIKSFKYSYNGYEVTSFEPDEYSTLDPEVLEYGRSIGAIEDSGSIATYPASDHDMESSTVKDQGLNIRQPAESKKRGKKQ